MKYVLHNPFDIHSLNHPKRLGFQSGLRGEGEVRVMHYRQLVMKTNVLT